MISEATKDSANATLRDAKNTAFSAKNDLRNAANDSKYNPTETAAVAGRQVRDFVDTAGEQIQELSEKVTTEVRKNPVGASVAAIGLGFILGVLFRR